MWTNVNCHSWVILTLLTTIYLFQMNLHQTISWILCNILVWQKTSLERIEHCAMKLVKNLSTLPYEDRLVSLQLQSLYCRRQHCNLIKTFKILNDFTNVQMELNTVHLTRGHPFKLLKNRCNLELRKHFFKAYNKSVELSTKPRCICTNCELF